jgi:hypothetical protein
MTPALDIGIKRATEMAAIFMIGDGLLGLAQPDRHVRLWRSRFRGWDALVRPYGGKSAHRRFYGVVQVVAGLSLAASLLNHPASFNVLSSPS